MGLLGDLQKADLAQHLSVCMEPSLRLLPLGGISSSAKVNVSVADI